MVATYSSSNAKFESRRLRDGEEVGGEVSLGEREEAEANPVSSRTKSEISSREPRTKETEEKAHRMERSGDQNVRRQQLLLEDRLGSFLIGSDDELVSLFFEPRLDTELKGRRWEEGRRGGDGRRQCSSGNGGDGSPSRHELALQRIR